MRVANMRFVKPLDHDLVRELALSHDLLVSLEENAVAGGAGSEVQRFLESQGIVKPLLRMGVPDPFIDHGDQAQMLAELELDARGIVEKVQRYITSR